MVPPWESPGTPRQNQSSPPRRLTATSAATPIKASPTSSTVISTPINIIHLHLSLPPFLLHIHQRDDDLVEHGQPCRRDLQIRLAPPKDSVRSVHLRDYFLFPVVRHELEGAVVVSEGAVECGSKVFRDSPLGGLYLKNLLTTGTWTRSL